MTTAYFEDTPLAKNLTSEMLRTQHNDHSLAKKAGLKPDVVRDIMRGKTKDPSARRLALIARVLDRYSEELLGMMPLRGVEDLTARAEQSSYVVHDREEIGLLDLWRDLETDQRKFMLTIVREALLLSRKTA